MSESHHKHGTTHEHESMNHAAMGQDGMGSETDHAGHGGHSGHEGHGGHGDHVGQFRRLFWIMLVIAVPVIVFSGMFAMILGYSLPDVPLISWISPVLGTVMYIWGGRPFLTGAVSELRSRKPGMML